MKHFLCSAGLLLLSTGISLGASENENEEVKKTEESSVLRLLARDSNASTHEVKIIILDPKNLIKKKIDLPWYKKIGFYTRLFFYAPWGSLKAMYREKKQITKLIKTKPYITALDEISQISSLNNIFNTPRWGYSNQTMKQYFNKVTKIESIPSMGALINKMKNAGYKIAYATNMTEEEFNKIKENINIFGINPFVVATSTSIKKIGESTSQTYPVSLKDNSSLYFQILGKELKESLSDKIVEIIFVDSSLENLNKENTETLSKETNCDISMIQFKSAQQLEKDLGEQLRTTPALLEFKKDESKKNKE